MKRKIAIFTLVALPIVCGIAVWQSMKEINSKDSAANTIDINSMDIEEFMALQKKSQEDVLKKSDEDKRRFEKIVGYPLIIFVMLFFFYGVFSILRNNLSLYITGIKTKGVYSDWDDKINMPVITFKDDKGKEYSFTANVRLGSYTEGGKALVLYDKHNPAKACAATWREIAAVIFCLSMGVLFLIIFIGLGA
jgi:hypothetical protein